MKKLLKTFKASTPDLDEDWERFETEDYIIPKWNAAKAALDRGARDLGSLDAVPKNLCAGDEQTG